MNLKQMVELEELRQLKKRIEETIKEIERTLEYSNGDYSQEVIRPQLILLQQLLKGVEK